MKKRIQHLYLLLFMTAILHIMSCYSKNNSEVKWKVEDGYVPNESSSIKIAEIVWLNVYGSKVESCKPFKAKLRNGSVWIVEGTSNSGGVGGVPYIEIQKSDGKILNVTHGK